MIEQKIEETFLSNGVRILTKSFPWLDKNGPVSFGINVSVGSAYEDESNYGAFHFVEHMCLFGASRNLSPNEFTKKLLALGHSKPNASINYLNTYYGNLYEDKSPLGYRVLKEDFVTVFDVFSDTILYPAFDQITADSEKERILIEDLKEAPYMPSIRKAFASIWNSKWLIRPIAGYKNEIEALTPEILCNTHTRFYTGDRFTLVAVGAIKHDEFVNMARKEYGRLQRDAGYQQEKGVYTSGEHHIVSKLPPKDPNKRGLTEFLIRFACDSNTIESDVLNSRVSYVIDKILFEDISTKDGDVYGISAEHLPSNPLLGNEFIISFECPASETLTIAEKVFSKIANIINMRENKRVNGHIENANTALRKSLLLSEPSTFSEVANIVDTIHKGSFIISPSQRLGIVKQFSAEDIAKCSADIFSGTMCIMSLNDENEIKQLPTLAEIEKIRQKYVGINPVRHDASLITHLRPEGIGMGTKT